MIQIAPSILSADFTKLDADLDAIATADMVHFDVMDGAFVPNISYGMPICKAVNQYTDMFLDTHLMIEKPARYIEDFAKAGADLISVHLEADGPRGIEDALNEMERCGVKKAVALRPITSPKAILPYIERLDMVLVMTVEPGFGGQSFMDGSAGRHPPVPGDHRLVQSQLSAGGRRRHQLQDRSPGEGGWRQRTGGWQRRIYGAGRSGGGHPGSAGGVTACNILPPALEALTEQFAKLPGIGTKTAQRLAFYVLNLPDGGGGSLRQCHSQRQRHHHPLSCVSEPDRRGGALRPVRQPSAGQVHHLRGGRPQGRHRHGAQRESTRGCTMCSTGSSPP